VRRALDEDERHLAATRWSDALSSAGALPSWGGVQFGSRLVDSRTVTVAAPRAAAFAPIRRIGGDTGWYCANILWRMRGWVDLVAGGVGMRRGRRDPEACVTGDPIDFWRVSAYEPDHLLRLEAEMRVPGRAWLEFTVDPLTTTTSRITQVARFEPSGLLGRMYWYALLPAHALIFSGMLRSIGNRAQHARVVAAPAA
jgi:hypothetical protein